jgi:hypothetical protein
VKHLTGRRLWPVLLGSVLIVVGGLLLLGRSRVESAGASGIVELAFTSTLLSGVGGPIAAQYQRVTLNVQSVRLTPSTDLSLSDLDPSWVTIPAPAGIASNIFTQYLTTSLNFGTSGTLLTAPTNIMQLDLMPLQNLPIFFNAVGIPANTYEQIELVLNSTTPGNVVPLCPQSTSGASAGEGCVTYQAALIPGAVLRVLFANGFIVPAGSVQPLVVNLATAVGPRPGADPSITGVSVNTIVSSNASLAPPQGNLSSSGITVNPALGVVTGTVTNFDLSTTIVTAEYAGTDQVVASGKLQPNGTFLLELPAAATPNSMLYDFYVSGSGSYVVRSHVAVSSQGTAPSPPPPTDLGTLAVPGSALSSLSGTIADACTGIAIEGATLKLMVPDTTAAGSATTCDPTGEPPAIPSNCVTVATAATDDQGHYPLQGTPFTSVPVSPPPGVPYYNLAISTAGFNTALPQVGPGLVCPTSRFPNSCSFTLDHGYLTGAVQISGPTGSRINAMVMAEDSGTNNIENLTLAAIPGSSASAPFTISVPDAAPSSESIPVRNYDLFASVQNLFQTQPEPNSGQLIGTVASVGSPPADCATLGIPALSPMDCAGLASVYGSVETADPSTTSVGLSKDGVQIMRTEPNSIGVAPNGNVYNFCAPSDSYELTHYENGIAQSSEPITLARPVTIGSPCASICQGSPKGTCLLCQPLQAPTLP